MYMATHAATRDGSELAAAASMLRALGHPVRMRLVQALAGGQRCVSELQHALDLPQAVVSQQLAKMRAAGIVTCRRDGANVRYAVADERAVRLLACVMKGVTPVAPRWRTTR